MSDTSNFIINDVHDYALRRFPVWQCEKHGQTQVGVQFYWPDKPTKTYCMECYHDLIAQSCCEVVQES